ncbi:hypothetical protein CLV56_4097 [Mumia flava]|uniref:Helix-turn-helix protein n=1 Tax=Mumia flava TaxID=1348852 RepID=A0A2M9AQ73_9ACTN|nr:hypothetical protein [Mumia flava]PJJ47838.1 hypothetical protein CLV56_4097 [Mumia flava]
MSVQPQSASAYERVGWLLRQWRTVAGGAELRRLQPFAALLTEQGHRADASRVSRWESGRLRVPVPVIESYESLLGIERATLVALAEGVARSFGERVPARDTEPSGPATYAEARELVLAADARGADWFEWAGWVTQTPKRLPEGALDDVEALAPRLVSESARAVGIGYGTRFEALRRLIDVPDLRTVVMRAVGAHVIASDAQATLAPIMLIADVHAEKAVDTLITLLTQPSAQMQLGAVWGLRRKLVRLEVSPRALAALEAQLAQMLFDATDEATLIRAANLIDVMPPAVAERLRRVRPALFAGRSRGPASSAANRAAAHATAIRAVAARIEAISGRDLDAVGRAIVEDAYHADDHDLRHQSALILSRSPFAPAIAEVLIEQTHPPRAADGATSLMPYLAGKPERDALVARLQRPDVDARPTLIALAHTGGGPVPGNADFLSATDVGVRKAALYLAGMQQDPLLRKLVKDPDADAAQRAGACWWLEHGGRVADGE